MLNSPSHNGHPRAVLPMFSADRQKLLRGSVNASATHIDMSGRLDAFLSLWRQMIELICERPVTDVSEIDEFRPETVTSAVVRRITGHPELLEPSSDLDELTTRVRKVRELQSGKPSRLLREIRSVVEELVGEATERVRRGISKALGTAPKQAAVLIETVRHVLEGVSLSEPNAKPLTQLSYCLRGLEALHQRRVSLPESSAEFIKSQLTQRAQQLYPEVLRALAEEIVGEEFRGSIRSLGAYLDERQALGTHFTRAIDDLLKEVEKTREAGLHQQVHSGASVILELPGPSEGEIFTGMLVRQGAGDRRDLAERMLQRLESELRELAAEESPSLAESAGLAELLTRVPPRRVVGLYEHLFAASLGEGHNLYEIIERYGITRTVEELVQRADPLCHLNNRDIAAFNVIPTDQTVVRLPPPVGPNDAHIRRRVEDAFCEHAEGCTILDATGAERDGISVVKVNLGWPLAVEHGNAGMLLHYARCVSSGHRPHLIGIMPESSVGKPVAEYVELAWNQRTAHPLHLPQGEQQW